MRFVADVQELKSYKKKRKRRSRFLRTLIVCLIIIFVFVFVAFSEGWIDESFFESIKTKPEGYPVSVVGGVAQDVYSLSNHIMLLTDTDVVLYNKYGEISSQTGHNSSHPHVVAKNDKALIYDKGYNHFQIQDKNGIVYSSSTNNSITNADFADNGSYAISTTSTRFLSEMYVYNKNNNEICYWKSTNGYISAMSFSKTSKKLAVSSIYAENGELKSGIRLFDLNRETDPIVFEKEFLGSSVISVQYLDNFDILLVFDDSYLIINEKGNIIKEYKYDYELYYQNTSLNCSVLVFKDNSGKLFLHRIGGDSSITTMNLEETDFKSLAFNSSHIFVLGEENISSYNLYGQKEIKVSSIADAFEIAEKDGLVYALNFTQIKEF